MGQGKQNAAGQIARRQALIDYIKEHGPVKGGDVCKAFSLSRSSFSDDIRAINAQASILLSPKRGTYVYNPDAAPKTDEGNLRGRISKRLLRRWLILCLLSRKSMSVYELLEELDAREFECSATTLQFDMNYLFTNGYVTRKSEGNTYWYSSAYIYAPGAAEINTFQKTNQKRKKVSVEAYESIQKKLAHCGFVMDGKSPREKFIGKYSHISKAQMRLYDQFQKFPYSEYALSIPYTTNNKQNIVCNFYTGMIVYAVETNRIHLIGKNDSGHDIVIGLDRIQMDKVAVLPDRNHSYDSAEYNTMFREMFQLSTDNPVHVRIRFHNMPFIADKINRLWKIRKASATITVSDDGKELIYEDTIRGLTNFARYIRSFGRSVIVDEPRGLRESIMNTSRKVLALYGETSGENEGAGNVSV